MTENTCAKLFEHNNWANRQIIRACSALSDDQLDTLPKSGQQWSIRQNLVHLVESQQGYLSLLTVPLEARGNTPAPIGELEKSADSSGEALLSLAQAENGQWSSALLQTRDGYRVEPGW